MRDCSSLGFAICKGVVGVSLLAGMALQPGDASAGDAAVAEVQRAAYEADFKTGIANLKSISAADPADAEAAFGIGGLEFLQALANLQEALWRHSGGNGPAAPSLTPLASVVPFGLGFGMPVLLPPNPRATPMTYQLLRTALHRFADDLASAEASLARVGDRLVKLPLQPFRIAMDLNHDGRIETHERLLGGFGALISGPRVDTAIAFDTADASWLRGYTHVLMASANLLLACDFERSYEAVAHNLYGHVATAFGRELRRQMDNPRQPEVIRAELDAVQAKLSAMTRSPVDQAKINELRLRLGSLPRTPEGAEERRRINEEIVRLNEPEQRRNLERSELFQQQQRLNAERMGLPPGADYAGVLDLVALVHTVSWPIVEPKRLAAVRTHLQQVMALNRATWRLVRSETDDDREWLPSARQASPFGGRQLTDEVIDSWLATTALAEQVLKGERLLPHPRFRKGVNLKRFFETARHIDLVMIVSGHALVPYLDDGEIVDARAWQEITRPMQQNFWHYALWFN